MGVGGGILVALIGIPLAYRLGRFHGANLLPALSEEEWSGWFPVPDETARRISDGGGAEQGRAVSTQQGMFARHSEGAD